MHNNTKAQLLDLLKKKVLLVTDFRKERNGDFRRLCKDKQRIFWKYLLNILII